MSETMTELKPVAWFFRWPGSTSWRNSDVDPTGRIPNEQFATVLCAYDHETIASALSAAEARGREAAAKLIEDSEIVDSNDGQTTRPRSEGNRAGLAYAAAIRKGLTP